MTNFAYFADLADGTVLEFRTRRVKVGEDRTGAPRYRIEEPRVGLMIPRVPVPGYVSGNALCGYDRERGWVQITRTVQMKSSPSRHECDARCMSASGRSMNCECACGGRNHGRDAFVCEAA